MFNPSLPPESSTTTRIGSSEPGFRSEEFSRCGFIKANPSGEESKGSATEVLPRKFKNPLLFIKGPVLLINSIGTLAWITSRVTIVEVVLQDSLLQLAHRWYLVLFLGLLQILAARCLAEV